MSEGADSPAALQVKGDQCMCVCMCMCGRGVTTGQPLTSEPVDLIGQKKKTCPLVEPSLAAAWPFCPCMTIDFFFFPFPPLSLYISFDTHSLYFPHLILLLARMASRRSLRPP